MTKILKVGDLSELQAVHSTFDARNDSHILLMYFFILHHTFCDILNFLKT